MVTFFAANFTEGKRQKAINLLDNNNQPLRKKDAVLLTYFAGVLTMISLLLILLFVIPYQSGVDAGEEILASMSTFRFVLMLILMTLSAAVCVRVFREYKINYIFIMDLDPNYKITHV